MKKIILIFLACFVGLFFTELFFRFIIKYPTYNIAYKAHGVSKVLNVSNFYLPNAKYWSIEAGNKIFERNNLGLPGIDIDTSGNTKFIYILGNSYVEALQVNPSENPVSIFQSKIKNLNKSYQTLNLAYSGQDPYSLYFRSRYFESLHTPTFVLLLINWDYPILHNDSLSFNIPGNFGVHDQGLLNNMLTVIRNHSSYFELLAKTYYRFSDKVNEYKIKTIPEVKYNQALDKIEYYSGMNKCINKFNETYKGKFICIYFGQDQDLESELQAHCTNSNIPYYSRNILAMQKANKAGHYNANGCKNLGELMYEAFCKYFK